MILWYYFVLNHRIELFLWAVCNPVILYFRVSTSLTSTGKLPKPVTIFENSTYRLLFTTILIRFTLNQRKEWLFWFAVFGIFFSFSFDI